jgi:iron complex transport system ATP-binding protein
MPEVEAQLQIEGLTVTYGSRVILDAVSLSLQPGEILALIGPNGAGKTTLIKAVSGVLPASAGNVLVCGQEIRGLSPTQRARLVAVVPQARLLPEAFTVWQTVLMGRTPYLNWLGQPAPVDLRQTQWALERTGLVDFSQRLVGQLSGGEQQRVLLARALAQDTPILLLDEPTAHLDLRYQSDLLNLVRELASERRLSILIALHDLNLVALYAHRTALLVEGQLRGIGTPEEVLTPERLFDAYQTHLDVVPHPSYGTPLILPNGR